MAVSRYYSSVARATTLTGDINASATSATVAAATGFPSSTPYTMIIDQDTVNEEVVEVTARSGTTLTITRGVDGTTGISHTAGAAVEHGFSARDFSESRQHEDASEQGHGLASGSAVIGENATQTRTNKTLTNPTINAATVSGTITGGATMTGQTFTSATLTSPTINGATLSGTLSGGATLSGQTITSATLGGDLAAGSNKITGLSDPASAQDASTKAYVASVIATGASNAAAAATSATAAATSATASATSATSAATEATASATSATASASSATAAAASYDSFDDRYLGAKSSDPSVDNDGDALVTGALVFNTTSNEMKVYNGSAWQLVDSSTGISETLIDAKGDLIVGSADNTAARLAVGTNGFVLTADSAEATGLKWSASTGGGAGLQDVFFLMGA